MTEATAEQIAELSVLDQEMDNLTRARRRAIGEYDKSADGSKEKQNALAKLAVLGRRIVAVETQLDGLVDVMLAGETKQTRIGDGGEVG